MLQRWRRHPDIQFVDPVSLQFFPDGPIIRRVSVLLTSGDPHPESPLIAFALFEYGIAITECTFCMVECPEWYRTSGAEAESWMKRSVSSMP
ncbi:MAG: hypothetical protein IPJ06_19995 [Saprospiraceae bacterium]|nr:hypothetical protein [Saprospiraceae bacterium]